MDNSTIIMNLQCFIALAQFDPFTGETALYTDAETEQEITACEESIKFLNGVPEEQLLMARQDISAVLVKIQKSFTEHISALSGLGVQEGVIDLDRSQEEAFKCMNELLNRNKEGDVL